MTDKVDKPLSPRKGVLAAEFLSDSYRISCEISLKSQTLVDALNDKMSTFLRADNIYISPVSDPAVFKAQYSFGQVRKENISLVVLMREEDGVPRHSMYHSSPTTPMLYNLFATVTGFEVRGGLRITSPVDIDNMLMQSTDRFITIYRAMATATDHPDIQFTGGAILLNREKATIFCVDKIDKAAGS